MSDRNEGGAPWQFRRRLATGTLIYCGVSAMFAMSQGPEMVAASFPTLGTIVTLVLGFYFTAAVMEDRAKMGG